MDTALLQEILAAQTRQFQKKGLNLSQAKEAALDRLLQRACAGLFGLQAFALRCQIRAAARETPPQIPKTSDFLSPDIHPRKYSISS